LILDPSESKKQKISVDYRSTQQDDCITGSIQLKQLAAELELEETVASKHQSLKMAEAPISKKRKRGNPNRKTGLIGVYNMGKKYQALIRYGGTQHTLGTLDTKEKAGIAYDRFVVGKSTEVVSFTLNYPNGLPTSGTSKDGIDKTDPTKTIKQDPEAELILHKAKEIRVKVEPEAEF
jgi:hypothetical protein